MSFAKLGLHAHLLATIEQAKFTNPTPVQEQSIPHIMAGKDVMACAQTGTGKTAAFTLPTAHRLLSTLRGKKSKAPRVLVLTPTRELADQVLKSIKLFIKGSPLKAGVVVGGVSYGPQIQMLRCPLDILVATPGRLIDHMNEGYVDLSQIEMLVLDEADRMLDMGFAKPVERIVGAMPEQRQTLLFSATFDKGVEKLAKQFLTDPVEVKLAASTQEHKQIKQSVFYTSSKEHKTEQLKTMLEDSAVWQAIVFIRTKHGADRLARQIENWGHETAALHGDMRQSARKRVVEKMHKGTVRVLVATDVAARGLDVKGLSHVVNFDLPQVAEDYIHRIGRTGRAGAEGVAISYVNKDEMPLLRDIEKMLGQAVTADNEPHQKSFADGPKPGKSKFNGSRNGAKGGFKGSGRNGSGSGPKRDFKSGPRRSDGNRSDGNRSEGRGEGRGKSFGGQPPRRGGKKPAFGGRRASA